MKFRRTSNGEWVHLAQTSVGVGGEARIFAVQGDSELVAKLYHRPTTERAAKLAAMLANPPDDPMAEQGHVSIAWPVDMLRTPDGDSQVVGFLMPLVQNVFPIIDFYHPKTRHSRHPLFHYRYLLRTARNLAASVGALHASGCVIGDLNESNILVGETALVSLVDTDSFQVCDPVTQQIYRCHVGKPEFTPPELQAIRFERVDRQPAHDLFGLGVLIFQLLMEGTHPFAGRHAGHGESPSLEQRIAEGAFPYGPVPGRALPMLTAPPFEVLDEGVRGLFLRCFEAGHTHPASRPTAQEWQDTLLAAENSLKTCETNEQHQFSDRLAVCPWCRRREQFRGRDPFPSRKAVTAGRRIRLARPVPLNPPDSVSYEEAIHLASVDERRLAVKRVVVGTVLCCLGLGVVFFWLWVIQNALC